MKGRLPLVFHLSSLLLLLSLLLVSKTAVERLLVSALLALWLFSALWGLKAAKARKRLLDSKAKFSSINELTGSEEWNSDVFASGLKDLVSETSDRMQEEELRDKSFTELRLSVLQSQMNPHFLYNTLDCIRNDALMADDREAATMLEALGTFCRYNNRRHTGAVSLFDEIENVKCYMKIQNYRFSGRYHLAIDFKGEEDLALSSAVPKLMLQPIVENSIVHGLENKREGSITLTVDCTDSLLTIVVADDGEGMDERTLLELNRKISENVLPKDGHGLALTNVNQQIQLLFGKEYGLHIYSTEGLGTAAEITLPRRKLEKKA